MRVSKQGEVVRVLVVDDGKAIDKEVARGLFEPFAKGDAARTGVNGTGLGLAISNLIVEKSGGRL